MTILKSIIEKNKGKLMKEYLQLLIKNLCYLQHKLNAELCINKFIYNKFINIYQDISNYQYICLKPVDSLTDLINNLCSSIITF